MNSFNNSIENNKESITYFKDKNVICKKKCKKYKRLITMIESFDTIVYIATTSSSFSLSLTGFGLLITPISSSTECGLTINERVIFEIVMQKYKKKQETK